MSCLTTAIVALTGCGPPAPTGYNDPQLLGAEVRKQFNNDPQNTVLTTTSIVCIRSGTSTFDCALRVTDGKDFNHTILASYVVSADGLSFLGKAGQ